MVTHIFIAIREEEVCTCVSNVEGRSYKSSHNDVGSNVHKPLLESQLRDLNEASISSETDALEETLITHMTMDDIFVSLIIGA